MRGFSLNYEPKVTAIHLQSLRDHSFNLEDLNEGSVCFIYIIHIFIAH